MWCVTRRYFVVKEVFPLLRVKFVAVAMDLGEDVLG